MIRLVNTFFALCLLGTPAVAAMPCKVQLPRLGRAAFTTATNVGKALVPRSVKTFFYPPVPMAKAEYQTLKETKVADIFTGSRPREEEIADFKAKLAALSQEFAWKQGTLRASSEAVDKVVSNLPLLLENGFLQKSGHRTLEQVLLDHNFLYGAPADTKPISPINRFLWRPIHLTLIDVPQAGARRLGRVMVFGLTTWFGLQISQAFFGGAGAQISEPISNNMTQIANENLGWLGVWMSDNISELRSNVSDWWEGPNQAKLQQVAFEEAQKEALEEIQHDLKVVNEKYLIGGYNYEEAKALWTNIDKVLIRHKEAMSRMLPDNVATGRTYFRDANIVYPVTFISAAMTAETALMAHETKILLLEAKDREVGLSLEEQVRLTYHREQVPISKDRLAGILTGWYVFDVFYPEFNRARFMTENYPEALPLMKTYEKFRENFHVADYHDYLEQEMATQLEALGMRLTKAKSRLKDSKNQLATSE